MGWYLSMVQLHTALVAASALLFLLRGVAAVPGYAWPLDGRVRAIAFALDFLIVLTGLSLWALLLTSPLAQPWFGLKLLLVLAYMGLAHGALHGRGAAGRMLAWLAALACLAAIVALSLRKTG